MKDIKLYIEVVYYKYGISELRLIREYVNRIDNTERGCLGIFKNNFLGKIRAKRQLAKWKKYHKLHDFSGDNEYLVIEEIIY